MKSRPRGVIPALQDVCWHGNMDTHPGQNSELQSSPWASEREGAGEVWRRWEESQERVPKKRAQGPRLGSGTPRLPQGEARWCPNEGAAAPAFTPTTGCAGGGQDGQQEGACLHAGPGWDTACMHGHTVGLQPSHLPSVQSVLSPELVCGFVLTYLETEL